MAGSDTLPCYEIVPANERTVAEVEAWLDAEETAHQAAWAIYEKGDYDVEIPPRGFRCNWNSVKRTWREGTARLDMLIIGGETVGFLDGTDILEIRSDVRGNGYGRILADFMVARAVADGISVLEIEIAPSSAEPFWVAMGFSPVHARNGPGGGIFAYRVLPRVYEMADGPRVPYTVEFFTEKAWYAGDFQSFASFEGEGELLPDGAIQLSSRAYCFDPQDRGSGDYFARISVGGSVLFGDKTKREAGKAIGIERDAGYTYFIDRIHPKRFGNGHDGGAT